MEEDSDVVGERVKYAVRSAILGTKDRVSALYTEHITRKKSVKTKGKKATNEAVNHTK